MDEAIGWTLAAVGIYTQFSRGFGDLPFPFNLALFPLSIVERCALPPYQCPPCNYWDSCRGAQIAVRGRSERLIVCDFVCVCVCVCVLRTCSIARVLMTLVVTAPGTAAPPFG